MGPAIESMHTVSALRAFSDLPDEAFVRLPVVEMLFACSTDTVERRIRAGVIPKPHKIGHTNYWGVGALRAALAEARRA